MDRNRTVAGPVPLAGHHLPSVRSQRLRLPLRHNRLLRRMDSEHTHRKNTATCSLTAGNPHKNSRPKSGRLSFYGLPAIVDGCTKNEIVGTQERGLARPHP